VKAVESSVIDLSVQDRKTSSSKQSPGGTSLY
jgi:hypothetical protein